MLGDLYIFYSNIIKYLIIYNLDNKYKNIRFNF